MGHILQTVESRLFGSIIIIEPRALTYIYHIFLFRLILVFLLYKKYHLLKLMYRLLISRSDINDYPCLTVN